MRARTGNNIELRLGLVFDAVAIAPPPVTAARIQGPLAIVFTAGAVAIAIVIKAEGYAVAIAKVTMMAATRPEPEAAIARKVRAAASHSAATVATGKIASDVAVATAAATAVPIVSMPSL